MPLFIIIVLVVLYFIFKKNKGKSKNSSNIHDFSEKSTRSSLDSGDGILTQLQGAELTPEGWEYPVGTEVDELSDVQNSIFDQASILLPAARVTEKKYISGFDLKHNCFHMKDVQDEMGQYSYFILEQFNDRRAQFYPVSDVVIQKNAIAAFHFVLAPVCILENEYDTDATQIKCIKPGLVSNMDEQWELVSKCIIRLI